MTIKSAIKHFVPPILWNVAKNLFGDSHHIQAPIDSSRFRKIDYQGVATEHNMQCMHLGAFAEIYERYWRLNPANGPEVTRLRQYFACMLAEWSKNVEGDFLTAGISYGVAPRVIFDFIDFQALGKVWHFIDPFTGANVPDGYFYNTDSQFVVNQFPSEAKIVFHKQYIPDVFPIKNLERLSFVHLNTTAATAEALSLPYLYEKLSPGGYILIDMYAFGAGAFAIYESAIKDLDVSIFALVTGQGVIRKGTD